MLVDLVQQVVVDAYALLCVFGVCVWQAGGLLCAAVRTHPGAAAALSPPTQQRRSNTARYIRPCARIRAQIQQTETQCIVVLYW